jgi:biotin transport system ATP-binding protein
MIELRSITYTYDGQEAPALAGVSLEIREGEYVALAGPSGCGKTTLVRHLNALLVPTAGTVRVDGLGTGERRHHREIRRRVGMIFQHPDNQIVGMTVAEDVAFGPGNLALPPEEIRARVAAVLAQLGISSLAERAPHTLSGGEKRLVALAGVLAMRPRYIALDEPTAFLDPAGRCLALATMGRLHREGIGIVHITHDAGEMADAERLLVMEQGRIVHDGCPRDVFCRAELRGGWLARPPAMELMQRLNERGWALSARALTLEEACGEIDAHRGGATHQVAAIEESALTCPSHSGSPERAPLKLP